MLPKVSSTLRIGLISDTHGLLRPEAREFLEGCDHILHAGDIGGEDVLQELSAIAPITAVRGNNDKGTWAEALSETELVKFGEVFVYLIHDIAELDIDPEGAGVAVVVSGHSHQPLIRSVDKVLYVNPGSAGPRRFKLPIAAAELRIVGDFVTPRISQLGS
jgi:putative phosphoesterase